jgi:ankyrin repeat protein
MNKEEQLISKLVDDYFNQHHNHLYKEEIKISSLSEDDFKNHITNGTLTLDICKEWVEGGGDVDIKNKLGWTALIWASDKGHLEIVKLLVENGAKIDLQDNWGRTALNVAKTKKIKDYLKSKGVK